jgi:peptidoglycan hydrolase-like protein with peptidoglycan-binding domain
MVLLERTRTITRPAVPAARPDLPADRRSPEYIRWVQASLNRIMGSTLALDGAIGPRTRNVLRAFQGRHGLPADGIAGPRTEAALLAAGAATGGRVAGGGGAALAQLPSAGAGAYSYSPPANQYGRPETVRAIQVIGAAWRRAHPGGPRVGVGDLSVRGGGAMPGHVGHRTGLEVDLRPVRGDGREAPVTYLSPAYSRALTQELVDLIHRNGILRVRTILFNDPAVRGVQAFRGHDNHLHVRFHPPPGAPDRQEDREDGLCVVDRRSREYIRWVQQSLNDVNGERLVVDGIKGPRTTAAVQRFQRQRGLAPDGIVGPLTERALTNAGAPGPPCSGGPPSPPPSPPPPPPTPIEPPPAPPVPTACLDRCWRDFERCLDNTRFPPECIARLGACQRACGG